MVTGNFQYKHIIFILAIFGFLSSCIRKELGITDQIFKKVTENEGVYIYDIPPYLIKALIDDDSENNRDLISALENLEEIKILLFRTYNERVERKDQYFVKFDEFYGNNSYEDLIGVWQSTERVSIKHRYLDDVNSELIILLTDHNSFIALSLKGSLDFNSMTTLMKFGNIKTLQSLKDN